MAGLACAVCNTRSAMKHSGRACTAMAVPASTKVLTALMLPAHMRVQLPFARHIFIPTLHIFCFCPVSLSNVTQARLLSVQVSPSHGAHTACLRRCLRRLLFAVIIICHPMAPRCHAQKGSYCAGMLLLCRFAGKLHCWWFISYMLSCMPTQSFIHV